MSLRYLEANISNKSWAVYLGVESVSQTQVEGSLDPSSSSHPEHGPYQDKTPTNHLHCTVKLSVFLSVISKFRTPRVIITGIETRDVPTK